MRASPAVSGAAPGPPGAGPAARDPGQALTGETAVTAPAGLAAPRLAAPARAETGPAALAGRARSALLAGPAGLLLADLAALAAAAALSPVRTPLLAAYAVTVTAVLAGGGQYRLPITLRAADQAGRLVRAAVVASLGLLAWVPAGSVLWLALTSAGLLAAGRAVALAGLRVARRQGLAAEPALVVGTGETGQQIAAALGSHPELGLRPAGFLDTRPPPPGSPFPLLGSPDRLAEVVRQHRIRRVIVAFPAGRDSELVGVLRAARETPADVCLVPRLHEVGTGLDRACLDEAWGIPLVPLRRRGLAGRLAKRAFDVTAALVLLVLAGPLLLALAAAVRIQLRRPALFRQARVTGQGRLTEIVKLRTVTVRGDPDTCWAVPLQRVTALGRFLRATHLDELPQLVNVIRGEMSLVGPRPERPYFARRFEQDIPGYAGRHRVPAGLTGWAQVHGLNGDTSIRDRARFDNAYVEHWSFWLDLVILARTAAGSLAAAVTRPDDGLRRAHRAAPVPPRPAPAPGQTCPATPPGGLQ